MAAEPHRDAYQILQVVPAAHPDVIRAAYYALARIHHPDGDQTNTDLMSDLNWAYDQIRDRVRREAGYPAPASSRPAHGQAQGPRGPRNGGGHPPVSPPAPAPPAPCQRPPPT